MPNRADLELGFARAFESFKLNRERGNQRETTIDALRLLAYQAALTGKIEKRLERAGDAA